MHTRCKRTRGKRLPRKKKEENDSCQTGVKKRQRRVNSTSLSPSIRGSKNEKKTASSGLQCTRDARGRTEKGRKRLLPNGFYDNTTEGQFHFFLSIYQGFKLLVYVMMACRIRREISGRRMSFQRSRTKTRWCSNATRRKMVFKCAFFVCF